MRPTVLLPSLILIALAAGCSDSDPARETQPSPAATASAARSQIPATDSPAVAAATPGVPSAAGAVASPVTEAAASPAASGQPPTAPAADPPTPAPTPEPDPTPGATGIDITFTRLDCEGYRFEVASRPAALYRVHWTATWPGDGSPQSVSDAEVSQSPGQHAFSHEEDDWTEPGSNRLLIRAEDRDGVTAEVVELVDC